MIGDCALNHGLEKVCAQMCGMSLRSGCAWFMTTTESYIRPYPTPSYTTLLVLPTEGMCTVLSGLFLFPNYSGSGQNESGWVGVGDSLTKCLMASWTIVELAE